VVELLTRLESEVKKSDNEQNNKEEAVARNYLASLQRAYEEARQGKILPESVAE
jgi:hypothetical protein